MEEEKYTLINTINGIEINLDYSRLCRVKWLKAT